MARPAFLFFNVLVGQPQTKNLAIGIALIPESLLSRAPFRLCFSGSMPSVSEESEGQPARLVAEPSGPLSGSALRGWIMELLKQDA
jgi:hypothetical protein